jgi:uncharacterized protein
MNDVFADTSYYVALLGQQRDQHHAMAVDLARVCDGQTITTGFVLMEVGNWLSQAADRRLFLKLLDMLGADPQTTVMPATRELFEAGCTLFAQRMDKGWSLTDCVSFTVMQRQALKEALTADHHFEPAGFMVLLK